MVPLVMPLVPMVQPTGGDFDLDYGKDNSSYHCCFNQMGYPL